MKMLIALAILTFFAILFFYPLSTITTVATDISNHLIEQAKK